MCGSRSRRRRGEPRLDPRQRQGRWQGPRGAADCEHFFDGDKANRPMRSPAPRRRRGGRALGGAVRHQRWYARRTRSRPSSPRWSRHPPAIMSASTPTTTPSRRWRIRSPRSAPARARSRAAQRPRRALRQRQSRLHHPDLEAQAGVFREVRDRRVGRQVEDLVRVSHALDERLTAGQPPRALRRRERLRHQGRHSRLGDRQGPATYEHVAPRRSATGASFWSRSGRPLQRAGRARTHRVKVEKNDQRVARLLDEVKEREAIGYAYETAYASFELLARRMLGTCRSSSTSASSTSRSSSAARTATARGADHCGGQGQIGNDTLTPLLKATLGRRARRRARKDLGKYQKSIKGLKLIDYRVRILNSGTEAVTRVLIESEDENGEHWTTVGVSPNIIDASFQALMDSIVKLVKAGAPHEGLLALRFGV